METTKKGLGYFFKQTFQYKRMRVNESRDLVFKAHFLNIKILEFKKNKKNSRVVIIFTFLSLHTKINLTYFFFPHKKKLRMLLITKLEKKATIYFPFLAVTMALTTVYLTWVSMRNALCLLGMSPASLVPNTSASVFSVWALLLLLLLVLALGCMRGLCAPPFVS